MIPLTALHPRGCTLWLELYNDPTRLPRSVPSAPGFPLHSCRITTASVAHHRGDRPTLPSRPLWGFTPLRLKQGLAWLPRLPFRRRPIPSFSVSKEQTGRGREEESHLLAPLVCRASPITGTRLQAMPGVHLTMAPAGFPAGLCLGWRPRQVQCVCRGVAAPVRFDGAGPSVQGVAAPGSLVAVLPGGQSARG